MAAHKAKLVRVPLWLPHGQSFEVPLIKTTRPRDAAIFRKSDFPAGSPDQRHLPDWELRIFGHVDQDTYRKLRQLDLLEPEDES